MTDDHRLAREFVNSLRNTVAHSEDLWGGFRYTTTGNNLCHPRTLGFMARAAWTMPDVAFVEIDLRLNNGRGVKFQPDLAMRHRDGRLSLLVDFESPNSSDARIPTKDVSAYLAWCRVDPSDTPEYLVVTSLPDRPTDGWELRYASPGYYNEGHRAEDVCRNPRTYWYSHYARVLQKEHSGWNSFPITFANFDGRGLQLVNFGDFNVEASPTRPV